MEMLDTAELDDEQIESLLQQAEERMRNESNRTSVKQRDTTTSLPRPPPLDIESSVKLYVEIGDGIARADGRRLLANSERHQSNGSKRVEEPLAAKSKKLEAKKANAGPAWFEMPRTIPTQELKQNLQILRMRSVLDPKRHYKKESGKMRLPEYSQIGTMIEGPTEFYSARMSKADRKKTLVEEVLSGERDSGRFKRKYNEIQERKTSGKKAHYKARMVKKYGQKYKES